MRQIPVSKITDTVARLCQQANYCLPKDVWQALERQYAAETSETGREILHQILENARLAAQRGVPLCQDTGITEIFLRVGQDLQIVDGSLEEAVQKGVSEGYKSGYLRKSIVRDPLDRKNTGDNTPAVIYTKVVPGSSLEISIIPKGGGSENASALKMLTPSAGWAGIKEFVLETVRAKGVGACPPLIVGVGIGGNFSSVGLLAKRAFLRDTGSASNDLSYAQKEQELLREINATGIGPMGLGGVTTALAVHIESAPCHIASLPVAVSMQCHSCRKLTEII